MSLQPLTKTKCFGGSQETYEHASVSLGCTMRFSIFLPEASSEKPLPVFYWLSGLTCTDENFTVKAGAQKYAAEHQVIVVAPDTSPRGLNLPGEDDSWDFGTGAGFYVNATRAPFDKNYRMYDYIVQELPDLIEKHFPVIPDCRSICGHSMGGHGALVIGLKNLDRYAAFSAFAPICAPSQCPWGEKAFTGYLGEDREAWQAYDTCYLLSQMDHVPKFLVHQGTADSFLENQLMPQKLLDTCKAKGHPLTLRMEPGYDHSYFFIATFIGEHIATHAKLLWEKAHG